jgi:hypothetical protein
LNTQNRSVHARIIKKNYQLLTVINPREINPLAITASKPTRPILTKAATRMQIATMTSRRVKIKPKEKQLKMTKTGCTKSLYIPQL